MDPEDWNLAKPMERFLLLKRMRREDPAQARSFIAGRLAGEKPDLRVELIDCLRTGLSEDDRTLLEEYAENDRSEYVRRKAQHLLATMPTPDERHEVIGQVADAFEVGKSLIPWKGRTLHLRRTLNPHVLERARTARVTVAEVAGRLGLGHDEFLGLFPGHDGTVIGYLLPLATASEDFESLVRVCDRNEALDWPKLMGLLPVDALPVHVRRRVVRSLHGLEDGRRQRGDWVHLGQFNEGPLTKRQADLIVGSKAVEGYVGGIGYRDREDWAHLAWVAGLIPPASADAFRAAIVRSHGEIPPPISLYLDFVEAADRDAKDSGIVPHYEE
jgi:hypothetical protein